MQQGSSKENYHYFYHPDHLGSSSYLTDVNGDVSQHVEYLPYGELFLEERNNKWNTSYLFNAKELDEETGLYYYVNRYLDSKTSIFISADPLAEGKPNVSGYVYCLNNPLKYIDPTGLYEKESDAAKVADRYGAEYHQDRRTGQWFVSMDETGKKAYDGGGTLTRDFGQETNYSSFSYSSLFGPTSSLVTATSAVSSYKQYSQFSRTLDIWRGTNGKIYRGLSGRGPNRFTGSRALAKSKSARVGGVSTSLSIAGIVVTEIQYEYDLNQNPGPNLKHYLEMRHVRDQSFNVSGFFGVFGAASSFGYNFGYLIETVTGQNIQLNPYTHDFTPIEETLTKFDNAGIYVY